MDHNPLLGPVVTLIGWSLVMLIWMVVTRIRKRWQTGCRIKERD